MLLGLTGGIGSGKSFVSKLFQNLGCILYNSDERAKELYYDDKVKSKVLEILGTGAYDSSGKIDKKFISDKIFSDNTLLDKINALFYKAISEDLKDFVRFQPKDSIIVAESALLFESGANKNVNKVVVITAPEEIRIERVIKRDGISQEDVKKRMAKQWPEATKLLQSDFVIFNDGKQDLEIQVLNIYQTIAK